MNEQLGRAKILSKKVAKYILNIVHASNAWLLNLLGIIDFRVPPYTDRIRTSGPSIRSYNESGLATYTRISTIALNQGIALSNGTNILDFGCGVARPLLHFVKNCPDCKIYACDVSNSAIKFIKSAYPKIDTYANSFHPPLKYKSSIFDLVYSISVFSHLDLEFHDAWLKELRRVTKTGGYCLITTEGYMSLQIMRSQRPDIWGDVDDEMLRSRGFIYIEYSDFHLEKKMEERLEAGSKFVGVEDSYGNTLISPEYARGHYPSFGFEVVNIVPGILGQRQDLLVLQAM